MFPFENLSPTKFEEFCYDLLLELRPLKIGWRKGSVGESSPADQGRDIECTFEATDPDGAKRTEKWFVECKHHSHAVPPQHLTSAVSWARAERPDVLLIVCSGFLSNPAKEFLEKLGKSDPTFCKIRIWENKDLEKLCYPRQGLLLKHSIGPVQPFIKFLHPVHLEYLRWPPLNSLKFLFKLLDAFDADARDGTLSLVYSGIINPGFKKPESLEQTFGELLDHELSYHEFKKKCYSLSNNIAEGFLVQSIVLSALANAFTQGDSTRIGYLMDNNRAIIAGLKKQAPKKRNPRLVRVLEKKIHSMPREFEESYAWYCTFCTTVVQELFTEEMDLDIVPSGKAKKR